MNFCQNLIAYPHPNTGTFDSINVAPLNDSLVSPASVLTITQPIHQAFPEEDTTISSESIAALEGVKSNIQDQIDNSNVSLHNVSHNYWSTRNLVDGVISGSNSSFVESKINSLTCSNGFFSNLSAINASITNLYVTNTFQDFISASFENISINKASINTIG